MLAIQRVIGGLCPGPHWTEHQSRLIGLPAVATAQAIAVERCGITHLISATNIVITLGSMLSRIEDARRPPAV
jgi:hypothetical protein